jgi:hypothetical protein
VWPIPQRDAGGEIVKFKWTYEYLGPLGTGGQIPPIYAVAPLCSSPPIVTSVDSGPITAGTLFQLNSESIPSRIVYFYTDKKKIDNTSFELKIGYTVNICRNIQGPVCAPPGIAVDLLPCSSFVFTSVENPDPERFVGNPLTGQIDLRFTKDCYTRCATKVEQCGTWDCTPTMCYCTPTGWINITPEDATYIDEKKFQSCFSPSGDQACQECMIFSIGSPGCYTYSSGGVTYKVPRGCR